MRHGRRRALAAVFAVVVLWAGSEQVTAAPRYAAMASTDAGAPVRWACEPHDVYLQGAPSARHVDQLRRSLTQLSRATSVTWRFAGTVDADTDADDYRGTPIVVRFTQTTGYAGLTTLWRERGSWTGGRVVINTDVPYVGAPVTAKDWDRLHTLLLHELGHLAGLGHVSDPAYVMSDWGSAIHRRYSDGDREGLAQVGC
jgi:hypothetical protein